MSKLDPIDWRFEIVQWERERWWICRAQLRDWYFITCFILPHHLTLDRWSLIVDLNEITRNGMVSIMQLDGKNIRDNQWIYALYSHTKKLLTITLTLSLFLFGFLLSLSSSLNYSNGWINYQTLLPFNSRPPTKQIQIEPFSLI